MASIEISSFREEYPGLSDSEAAVEYAKKWGMLVIIRYKGDPDGEYTNLGVCQSESEAENYFNSPACHDVEVIYDGRWEKADQLTTFNNGALKRSIVFEEFGCASQPCCWNCRHFSVSISEEHFCTSHRTKVNRSDCCDNWYKRNL